MGSTTSEVTSGWQRRRFMSAALRFAVTLVPIVMSVVTVLLLDRVLPEASGITAAIGRMLALAACSLVALVLTDAFARRFLPLAALLQLSLVFPDQTPSRFKTALKGGSGRRLAREVAQARSEGLSDDPSRAAEQLLMLATAIGDHDRRTRGHSERVRLYTDLIAEELHLSDDARSKLQWAALIHDIGKIQVPAEILNKKGPPDDREWAILKRHPLAGERLAAPVEPWLGEAVHAIGGHHERWDGSGYPRGLKGDDISRSAAIVAVADAFEVMTAVRSYKKAMPLTDARAELTRCAGTHFSPDVVRALLTVSIGRLRRSMGIFAAMAHIPLLGQVTKAAASAPNTVSTAVGFTTNTATAGVGVLAITGGLAIAAPAAPSVPAPPATTSIEADAVPPGFDVSYVVPPTSAAPTISAMAETKALSTMALAPSPGPAPPTTVVATTIQPATTTVPPEPAATAAPIAELPSPQTSTPKEKADTEQADEQAEKGKAEQDNAEKDNAEKDNAEKDKTEKDKTETAKAEDAKADKDQSDGAHPDRHEEKAGEAD